MNLDESAMVWSRPAAERSGRPLLLALHGHNGDEHQLAISAAMLPAEMVIVTPRAPFREPGGWSWFELTERGIPDAQRIADELLAWVYRQSGYSSYGLLGLSQGGAMAMEMLRRAPTRFDYALQLSGFAIDTSDAPELARVRPPMFSAHGDLDTVIPPERAADTSRWLRAHTTLTEKRYPRLGHSIEPEELVDASAFIHTHLG